MRRWILRAVCWVVLGAAVNVGVAWACTSEFGGTERAVPRDGAWPSPAPKSWPIAPVLDVERGLGWTDASARATDWDHLPSVEYTMSIYQVGWPWHSLYRRFLYTRCGEELDFLRTSRWERGFQGPDWLRVCRTVRDGNLPPFKRIHSLHVPICPLWPGFALNSLVYALPIALLWLTPGQLRRWHRRRRNLCIHCAYPVADPAKPCSECGRLPTTR